jgi:hypothetical protein
MNWVGTSVGRPVGRLLRQAPNGLRGICVAMIVGTLVVTPAEGASPPRFSITPESVVRALEAAGAVNTNGGGMNGGGINSARINVEGATASVEDPQLVVEGLRQSPGRNWLEARLRCKSANECLPFYAIVSDTSVRLTRTAAMRKAGPSLSPVVRRGDRAILRLEGANLLATLSVICLETGGEGDRVRVREVGGRRVYSAQVVAAGLVQGKL